VIHQTFSLLRLAFLPIAGLIAYNLYANYYYVVTVDPGNPITILDEVRAQAPWMIRNHSEDTYGSAQGKRMNRLKACGKCGGPKPVV
jgi:hypothetical protein